MAKTPELEPHGSAENVARVEARAAGSSDDTIRFGPRAATARRDFIGALAWMALGIAILVGSWTMDRLEEQHINPYTVPGLLPGLLGLAMIFFSSLMLVRAIRRGGARSAGPWRTGHERYGRLLTIFALCLSFALGLVGHGLPFWVASAIYVSVSILVLQYQGWKASGQFARGLVKAVSIGIGAGVVVQLVFERFFLVRLP